MAVHQRGQVRSDINPSLLFPSVDTPVIQRMVLLTSERQSLHESTHPQQRSRLGRLTRCVECYCFTPMRTLNHAHLLGLIDLNSARRNATERYLINGGCDAIFAVCPIGRATTDENAQQVFDLARRASLPSVGIVCTQTDVCALSVLQSYAYAEPEQIISENEAVKGYTGDQATTIQTLKKTRDQCQKRIQELEEERQALLEDSVGECSGGSDNISREILDLQYGTYNPYSGVG